MLTCEAKGKEKVVTTGETAPRSGYAGITAYKPGPVKRAFRGLLELVWIALFVPAVVAALPFLFLIAMLVVRIDIQRECD